MGFKTKLDSSNNRQLIQRPFTNMTLSGTTTFGIDDVDIPTNVSGDTINIIAKQYTQTDGLIITGDLNEDNTLSKVLSINQDGKVVNTSLDYLSYIEVNSSRDFSESDSGKALIITNVNIDLTIPTSGLPSNFNCNIKALSGFNGTIIPNGANVDAPSGLEIEENKMIAIGRLNLISSGDIYIISP